jgi:GGDEF domain-containing protein
MMYRVRDALFAPFTVHGRGIRIGASVGVHLAPSESDPDQALRAADQAMYEVKRDGAERRTAERGTGRHRAES